MKTSEFRRLTCCLTALLIGMAFAVSAGDGDTVAPCFDFDRFQLFNEF